MMARTLHKIVNYFYSCCTLRKIILSIVSAIISCHGTIRNSDYLIHIFDVL